MSGFLSGVVGKKILAETGNNKFGQEDPYFEQVPASRLYRAFGKKTQKRRKAIPPGLSENDAKVLTKVKRRAYRLDLSLFNFCGIRFGWGSVIGLFPFIGDGADALLALLVLQTCEEIDGGLPSSLRFKMITNIVIDFAIGLVPFIGDLADAMYKCNTRNAVLLEKYLRQKGARALGGEGAEPGQVMDMSLGEEFDRQEARQELGVADNSSPRHKQPRPPGRGNSNGRSEVQIPARPEAAAQPQTNRRDRGWFGGSGH